MSTFEFWLLRSWTVVAGLTVAWLVVGSENIRKTSECRQEPMGGGTRPPAGPTEYINIELNLKKEGGQGGEEEPD